MIEPSYSYSATIVRWVDGDTVDLQVDCGFSIMLNERFRLYGIDTPERGAPGFVEASAKVAELAPVGSMHTIHTFKSADKYGRWLCLIHLDGPNGGLDSTTVNDQLVELGLARPYFGGHKG